jgi:hypothetical protein
MKTTEPAPNSAFVTFLPFRGLRLFQGLAVIAVGLGFAFNAQADTAPVVTVSPPIAPGIFHMVVNALPDSGTPPASPFIVAPGESTPPPAGDHSSGTLTGDPQSTSSPLVLQSAAGNTLLTLGTVSSTGTSTTFTFTHDPKDRFYGNGNDDRNRAGPLIHTSGKQVVNNGATCVPFIWSPSGYGVLVANDIPKVNDHITWSDSNGTLKWTVPAGFADIYLMAAADGAGVLGDYARLTGSAPIPPRWTFGYILSRWGYKDADDVQDKWRQFRDRKIPIDAFIYDYDWFSNDWEFNHRTFPDPAANLAQMHAMNLHFVGIRKPRVNGANLDDAKAKGWILTGNDLRFDLPDARDWWWSKQLPLLQTGVDGWWNDENFSTCPGSNIWGAAPRARSGSGPLTGRFPPARSTMARRYGPGTLTRPGRLSASNRERFSTGAWRGCLTSPMTRAGFMALPSRSFTRDGWKRRPSSR